MFPTIRDLLIAAEQPQETEEWVLKYIEDNPEAKRFVETIQEQNRFCSWIETLPPDEQERILRRLEELGDA